MIKDQPHHNPFTHALQTQSLSSTKPELSFQMSGCAAQVSHISTALGEVINRARSLLGAQPVGLECNPHQASIIINPPFGDKSDGYLGGIDVALEVGLQLILASERRTAGET